MKELVEYIARSLVDKPDAVSVQETQGESFTILGIRTAPEDSGKEFSGALKIISHSALALYLKNIAWLSINALFRKKMFRMPPGF